MENFDPKWRIFRIREDAETLAYKLASILGVTVVTTTLPEGWAIHDYWQLRARYDEDPQAIENEEDEANSRDARQEALDSWSPPVEEAAVELSGYLSFREPD